MAFPAAINHAFAAPTLSVFCFICKGEFLRITAAIGQHGMMLCVHTCLRAALWQARQLAIVPR